MNAIKFFSIFSPVSCIFSYILVLYIKIFYSNFNKTQLNELFYMLNIIKKAFWEIMCCVVIKKKTFLFIVFTSMAGLSCIYIFLIPNTHKFINI